MNLSLHLSRSLQLAEQNISKCSAEILALPGMSGQKTRHFYNNLVSMPGAQYLEIGSWKGSSVCSAMFENSADVTCIDNFSEFAGPKKELLSNFHKFKGKNRATFIDADCFSVPIKNLPTFNLFMYDAAHDEMSQYRALSRFLPRMMDEFVFVVDDWNWDSVKNGTRNAIDDLQLTIVAEHERFTSANQDARGWWNGMFAAVLRKECAS